MCVCVCMYVAVCVCERTHEHVQVFQSLAKIKGDIFSSLTHKFADCC